MNRATRKLLGRSGFTLAELVVSVGATGLIVAAAFMFVSFARVSVSMIMAQTVLGDQSGRAVAFMQSRIRLANSVSVDAAGNTLTLGFDDDPKTDSDGDTITYNDKDHYESFQFQGTNGTNSTTATANKIVYTKKVGVTAAKTIVPYGVRNLPSYNIFSVPNPNTVVIRFGMVDPNTRDRFQSIDIQATGVALNMPRTSAIVGIIP